MTISFTIPGNHKDPLGNPVPKLKMTGRQRWTDKAQEYAAWKQYVASAFLIELQRKGDAVIHEFLKIGVGGIKKPITLATAQRARMDIKIWWVSENHGDPENVFGSVADALFENDKHLDGSFESHHLPPVNAGGRTEVEVKIDEP